jgi:hypothetical protein
LEVINVWTHLGLLANGLAIQASPPEVSFARHGDPIFLETPINDNHSSDVAISSFKENSNIVIELGGGFCPSDFESDRWQEF